jgi:hypothetical protein
MELNGRRKGGSQINILLCNIKMKEKSCEGRTAKTNICRNDDGNKLYHMLGKKNQRKEMDAGAKRGEEGRKESKSQSSDEDKKN